MLFFMISVLSALVSNAVAIPTVYDQRQSGKSNIRIDVKDAVFIAISDEFGDYDYSYDYSDFTIKPEEVFKPPPTPSTVAPSPSSTSASTTTAALQSSAAPPVHNASLIVNKNNNTLTIKPNNDTAEPDKLTVVQAHSQQISHDYQIPVIVVEDVKEPTKLLPVKIWQKNYNRPVRNTTDDLPQLRHCSPGFFLDSSNRCKRIRRQPPRVKPQAYRLINKQARS